MDTRISDGIDVSIDVEESDVLVGDADEFACSNWNLIQLCGFKKICHGSLLLTSHRM